MRKLFYGMAALFLVASVAVAGNSVSLSYPPGGAGGPVPDYPSMCPDADCIAGDDVYYDADADCWYCCDPIATPGCGDTTPCVPEDCDPGDYIVWDDVLECWACSPPVDEAPAPEMCAGEACVAGDVLTWDPVGECFECDAVGPGDVAPCDPAACGDGDYLVWDDVNNCWDCQTAEPVRGRRYLARDSNDTVTPQHWWVSHLDNTGGIRFASPGYTQLGYDGFVNGASIQVRSALDSISPGYARLWSGSNDSAAADINITKWSTNASATLDLTAYTSTDAGTTELSFRGDMIWANSTGAFDRWFLLEDDDFEFGIGTTAAPANSSCIDLDSGADRLYADKDCDFTKDAGEEYLDNAGGAGVWTAGTNGLYYNGDNVNIGGDVAPTYATGLGSLFVVNDAEVGGYLYAHDIQGPGDGVGNDFMIIWAGSGGDPHSYINMHGSSNASFPNRIEIVAPDATGASDFRLFIDRDGATFEGGDASWAVQISDGMALVMEGSTSGTITHEVPATVTSHTLTWPSANASGALTNNGSGTLSWTAAAAAGTSVIRFDATALHAVEDNFAPIDEEVGTNVEYLMTLYGPDTDVCRNGKFPVPPDADLTDTVTVRLWFTGDGTADASGLDVIWYVKISDVDDGESYDTAYATQTFTAETLTTANDTTMFEITKTFTGTAEMAAGDFIFFGICRDADNGSDTYDGAARLAYIQWEFPE